MYRCPTYMEPQNLTGVSEFLLLGLSEDPELQPLLFRLFLSLYLVTVLGNLLIILAISSDPLLNTPMYTFLSSLSLADTGFSTTTIPKMLVNIQTHTSPSPMQAASLSLLFVVSFVVSLLDSLTHCLMASQLTFCKHVEIPHFFCEAPQLIRFACSDTLRNTILIYSVGAIFGGIPASGILYSYTRIVSLILKVTSTGVKSKTFSTWGSHLAMVCLFYGTGLEVPEVQPLLFGLFLSMYLITVLGNLLIILAVGSDPHLHTPMYFFLSSLSLADIGFTSTTVPKMLVNIQTHSKSINYSGCLTQMCFVMVFGRMDTFLLTVWSSVTLCTTRAS
ncbi:Olfactory Receptor 7E24 [Manis pentadactyla]|nr:Olfactory Receptor 7E24 [Manis pentadactyla]